MRESVILKRIEQVYEDPRIPEDITRKRFDEVGPPACPIDGYDLKEASSGTSKGAMNTDIGHFISAILDATDAGEGDLRGDVLFDFTRRNVNWSGWREKIIDECCDGYKIPRDTVSEILGVKFDEELRGIVEASIDKQLREIFDAPKGTEERAMRQSALQLDIVKMIER